MRELLVLRSSVLHLHLSVLSDRLLLSELRGHGITHLLVWLWLSRHLLDFFLGRCGVILHGRISHTTGSRCDILIFGPLFDLIICSFNKLVSEVQ